MIGLSCYVTFFYEPNCSSVKKNKYKIMTPGCEENWPPVALGLSPISPYSILLNGAPPPLHHFAWYAASFYTSLLVGYWRTGRFTCSRNPSGRSLHLNAHVSHVHPRHTCSSSLQQLLHCHVQTPWHYWKLLSLTVACLELKDADFLPILFIPNRLRANYLIYSQFNF